MEEKFVSAKHTAEFVVVKRHRLLGLAVSASLRGNWKGNKTVLAVKIIMVIALLLI